MAVTSADNLPTDAHQHVGFVSISPVRGTVELVWACAFTIILCTWNIQHLTIASPYKSAWIVMAHKILWALLTVFAPEFTCLWGIHEYIFARIQARTMQHHGFGWWTMKHSFFASMGGYLLEYQNEGQIIVRSEEILWLATEKLLVLPEIKCSEIDGLASEDTFQKAITAVQLFWFALQCIGRAVGRLEFALFELTTLCFVSYTIITLFCWWKKPGGVSVRSKISCPSISAQDVDRMLESTKGEKRSLMLELHIRQVDFDDNPPIGVYWEAMLIVFVGGVGAWHIAAWNYSFPSSVESILWKVSSVVATMGPIILWYAVDLGFPFYFIFFAYATARVFVVVETIISLRSAPAGIYERVRWSDFLPHV
ncbi:uncharacterized protein PV07_07526 [Cladophialophora immunda]|uniref:Uncharacterized protein n=1 Tax=Cladophialophora immunda TaxID=569365 RepID=A0A0D2C9Q7_9EURO|nr:uncharacterized protein PV07_07526 [Cladophialophora immunda]KIW27823.1 hypothetical protein PV07_07526 [Cladophialophora immunda]OQV02978.1 hypothetical protein CLAIMM_08085 [Cladophialophora immunda]